MKKVTSIAPFTITRMVGFTLFGLIIVFAVGMLVWTLFMTVKGDSSSRTPVYSEQEDRVPTGRYCLQHGLRGQCIMSAEER